MSDPNPSPSDPAARHGNGPKYLFLFLLGLVLGVVATVMVLRAWTARQDPFPRSTMNVQQWHLGQLKRSVEENRCEPTNTLPHLQALRSLANNIEPAFPDLRDDERFTRHTSQLRADLDTALSSPPLNCAGVGSTLKTVADSCKACHQDFRG